MQIRRIRQPLDFSRRVPWGVAVILTVTILLSIGAAVTDRHVGSVFEMLSLFPQMVWKGQVWRLFTWAFVETSFINLIFGCLALYWLGGDLAREWGSRRFLMVFGGTAIFAGVVTSLVALLDHGLMMQAYLGGISFAAALTVAWGLWFPDRQILIFFIIPMRGYVIAWFTIVATIGYAIYSGWERHFPTLFTEAAMLVYVYSRNIRQRILGLRLAVTKRQLQSLQKDKAKKRAKSVAYLRVVESHDDDSPDLPPEVDRKLDELLRGRGKRDRSMDN